MSLFGVFAMASVVSAAFAAPPDSCSTPPITVDEFPYSDAITGWHYSLSNLRDDLATVEARDISGTLRLRARVIAIDRLDTLSYFDPVTYGKAVRIAKPWVRPTGDFVCFDRKGQTVVESESLVIESHRRAYQTSRATTYYYPDGGVRMRGQFSSPTAKHDLATDSSDVWTSYYKGGGIRSRWAFDPPNERHGTFLSYYPTGALAVVGEYRLPPFSVDTVSVFDPVTYEVSVYIDSTSRKPGVETWIYYDENGNIQRAEKKERSPQRRH